MPLMFKQEAIPDSAAEMVPGKRPAASSRTHSRAVTASLLPLLLMLVAGSILYPMLTLLFAAFVRDGRLALDVFGEVAALPGLSQAIVNTTILVIAATTLAITVGTALAWLNEKTNARLGWVSSVVPVVPLLVSPVAGALGYVFLLSPEAGAINTGLANAPGWIRTIVPFDRINIYTGFGVVLVTAIYILPTIYVLVAAALRNLDASQEEASRMCGVGPWKTAVKVIIPSLRPTLASSAVLALIASVAMFTVPVIIGTRAHFPVLSVMIYDELNVTYPPRIAQALILGMLMLTVVQLGILFEYFVGKRARKGALRSRPTRSLATELGGWRWVGRIVTVGYLAAGTILPVLGLLYVSLQNFWSPRFSVDNLSLQGYAGLFADSLAQNAFKNSLLLGAVGATVAILIAALVALLMRNSPGWLRQLANALMGLPASIPHTVMGIAFLISFGTGFFNLSGTVLILFIAYVVMYLPHSARSVNSAFSQVGDDLYEASSMSGAGRWRTFFMVMLPLMAGGLIAGWVLVFVHMFNEVTASVFLAATSDSVIGPYIIDLWLNVGNYPRLAAMALVLCAANSIVVGGLLWYGRRRTVR